MRELYFIDKKNVSKYIVILLAMVVSVLFVLVINGVYKGYCRIQIENAYVYSGEWDVVTDGGEPELDVEHIATIRGPREFVYIEDNNGYEMYVCTQAEMKTLFAYDLTEGDWPENDDELVVSEECSFDGKSFSNGGLKVGDKIALKELTDDEGAGEKEYILVGFWKSSIINLYGDSQYKVFSGEWADSGNYLYYYRLKNYDIGTIKKARDYFKAGGGMLNPYLSDAIYNSYGSDYIRHVKNGINILTYALIVIAICIVTVNMMYIVNSDKNRNLMLYTLGCRTGKILSIYFTRLVLIVIFGTVFGTGLACLFTYLLGRKLVSIWHVYASAVNIHDLNLLLSPFIAFIIMFFVCLAVIVSVRTQIRGRTKSKGGIQRKMINTIYDLAQINISGNVVTTVIFILTLSAVMLSSAFVLGFSKKITDKISFVTGTGNGCDFSISSRRDIYNDINCIDGMDEIYMNAGGNIMCTTTISENNFIEEAKHTYNYDDFIVPDTYVYVLGLTKSYYDELSKFNDLPDYDELVEQEGCLVYSQFIDEEDGQLYDTFKLSGDEKLELKNTENGKSITVTPMANVSMPNYDREIGYLMVTFIVPENIRHILSEDENYRYDVYINEKKMQATLLQLRKLADKEAYSFSDNTADKIKQLDTYNTHIVIIGFIGIIVAGIAVIGLWSSVALERLGRKRQYEIYNLLGMSNNSMRNLVFAEYIYKLFDSMIIAALLLGIIFYKVEVNRMAAFYGVNITDMFSGLLTAFVVIFAMLSFWALLCTRSKNR